MPNPLTMVTLSPTATAKPDTTTPAQRDPNTATSFQTVMDQQPDHQPAEFEAPDLQVPEPEFDSDLEETIEEGEQVDALVSADDQTPRDARVVSGETTPDTAVETPVELSPLIAYQTGKMPETDRGPRPDKLRGDTLGSSAAPDLHAVPPALNTLVAGHLHSRGENKPALSPRDNFTGSTIAEARPGKQSDVIAALDPARDVLHNPPTPKLTPHQSTPPERAAALVQMQLLATEKTGTQTDVSLVPEIDETQAVREVSPPSTTRDPGGVLQTATATARAETARAIAGQIASVITTRPQSGTVEIALNPEELGRVSIVFNGRDDGLHMTIAAERPETLDMMRRHLSVLETEFRNLGMGELSIDLGTSSDAQQDGSEPNGDSPLSTSHPEPAITDGPAPPRLSLDGRIDVRL